MLDFDEVLVSVKNPQVKRYVEESISSYRVGNYRSAILAVWIAAMFDLVKKFEILVDQREPTAVSKWQDLKPKIESHKNWEKELIDAAAAVDMLSPFEADTLRTLSRSRNRYAHPSFDDVGTLFDPTPEEVRYFLRTLYDVVLSQPAQLGAFYVNQLLEALKNSAFFPNRLRADELMLERSFVSEKISRINPKQLPRLIKSSFQALRSPTSKEHELNLLCFVINMWSAQAESRLPLQIASHWDEYLSDEELTEEVLEALLSYPERLNELSEKSQEILDKMLRNHTIRALVYPRSFVEFLSYADVVPLAGSLLNDAPALIPLNTVIEEVGYYARVFGSKFSDLFGALILRRTREALITRNGYTVNPVLSALRECNIWDLANALSVDEQGKFAMELIDSLNSNNFETMDLLSFENRGNIPIRWINLLLEQWHKNLEVDERSSRRLLRSYLEHYLGLIERYTTELGNHPYTGQVLQIIISQVDEPSDLETLLNGACGEEVEGFWKTILQEHQNLIAANLREEAF